MKYVIAKILTFLLVCGIFTPVILWADGPLPSTQNQTSHEIITRGRAGVRPDSFVTSSAITITPSAITLTHFKKADPNQSQAFAIGTSQDELSRWFTGISSHFTGYDALGITYDFIPGIWSWEEVDVNTPGLYYASASPQLGTDYIPANGLVLPKQLYLVSIQSPGNLAINCLSPGRGGSLRFPWVFSQEQSARLKQLEASGQQDRFAAVWLREHKGDWIQLSTGYTFVDDSLQLFYNFKDAYTYDLQVDYSEGQTGVLSFQYDQELTTFTYAQGDRDGGDVSGGGSSEGSQPAPPPSQPPSDVPAPAQDHDRQDEIRPVSDKSSTLSFDMALSLFDNPVFLMLDYLWNEIQAEETFASDKAVLPAPAPLPKAYEKVLATSKQEDATAPVNSPLQIKADTKSQIAKQVQKTVPPIQESYSPEETVISRRRLYDLCAEGEKVLFGSGDLRVRLSSKLLLALDLSASDTLSVKLFQPKTDQVTFALEVSGQPVIGFPQASIELRYNPQYEDSVISVEDELNQKIIPSSFDQEFLRFTVDQVGSYTIVETSKSGQSQDGNFPLLPLSSSLLVATGGLMFFRWKRHG